MLYALAVTENVVSLFVRLPRELRDALRAWAETEHRSLNGQVIHLLQRAIEERKAGKGA